MLIGPELLPRSPHRHRVELRIVHITTDRQSTITGSAVSSPARPNRRPKRCARDLVVDVEIEIAVNITIDIDIEIGAVINEVVSDVLVAFIDDRDYR
ncbi:MAG: hypothetical protein R2706_15840 [Acidimicrobiales bacterium]